METSKQDIIKVSSPQQVASKERLRGKKSLPRNEVILRLKHRGVDLTFYQAINQDLLDHLVKEVISYGD